MRIIYKLLIGAAFCTANLPAFAEDHEFGSVNVSAGHFTDVNWSRFGGPVDHFSFAPDNDAVTCDHVTINYIDGTSHQVFSGYIAAGQRTTISLPPPNDGRIRDVDFACKAEHIDGTRITLSAVTDAWPHGWDGDRPAHVTTQVIPN